MGGRAGGPFLTALILWLPPVWKAPLMVSGVYIYAHNFEKTSRQELLEMYDPQERTAPLL